MIRRLMWFAIGFAAACALGAYCFTPWLAAVACFALLLSVLSLLWTKYKAARVIGTVFLGLALGIGWFFGFEMLQYSQGRSYDGVTLTLTLEASDYSYETDYGTAVEGYAQIGDGQYKILLYRDGTEALKPGDCVCCEARLRFTAHGGGEAPTYHRGNGILFIAYAESAETVVTANKLPGKYLPAVLRKELLERIDENFSGDTAFFAKALLLGERTDVDYETNTAFKVSGVSHIIAVSGLHLSILTAVIYWITGRRRVVTGLVGIPVMVLFAAVAGLTPSVTRACVMQSLMMLALLLDMEYDPPTALAFAAVVMLAAEPLVITSVSFQLSFGCVAGIILFSERIRAWFLGLRPWKGWKGKTLHGRMIRWLAASVSISVGAMVFTTPLVALYFGAVSLVGIVTNVLILWVVSLIFYGVLAVCLVSVFWSAGAKMLGWCFGWPIRYVLTVTKALASFPLAAVYTKIVYIIVWFVLCYGLLLIFLVSKRRQPHVLICCWTLGLCLALLCSWLEPLTDDTRLTVLDVGQGQSLILQSGGKTFLIDCGGDYDDDAADLAAETLLSQGISRLDGVIVTHYDRDHAGGVGYLLSRVPADTVFLPTAPDTEGTLESILRYTGGSEYFVDSDQTVSWEGGELTIFGPLVTGDDNESGLCVLFESENCDILVTGDMSTEVENLLMLYTDLPELTALVVGHHGSKYSTGEALLTQTTPEYAFISVGENPYGHPTQEVLDRLEAAGCKVYRTDQCGTIIFGR